MARWLAYHARLIDKPLLGRSTHLICFRDCFAFCALPRWIGVSSYRVLPCIAMHGILFVVSQNNNQASRISISFAWGSYCASVPGLIDARTRDTQHLGTYKVPVLCQAWPAGGR